MPETGCTDGPWDPTICMFDKNADLATQVKQSVNTSLAHLRVQQLDSLILHESRQPWEDLQVIWRAFEEVYSAGKAKTIGLSHIHDPASFRRLLKFAKVKPSFVQHPIFAMDGWDRAIREICSEHGIVYQAYSLNHAENDFVYQKKAVIEIANRLNVTPRQVIVGMIKRMGLLPLVGPQDPIKMAHAIVAAKYVPQKLTDDDMSILENIAFINSPSLSPKLTPERRTLEGENGKVSFSITNRLKTDIYMAWQTPDHSQMRTERGMHMDSSIIKAGTTENIESFHRHGFYFWDVKDGEKAPLYREGSNKRWVRRVRANGFLLNQDIIIDETFRVEVVNFSPNDYEVFIESWASLPGNGGRLNIGAFDKQSMMIRDYTGKIKTVTFHRSNGDPQLLSVGLGALKAAYRLHDEL